MTTKALEERSVPALEEMKCESLLYERHFARHGGIRVGCHLQEGFASLKSPSC